MQAATLAKPLEHDYIQTKQQQGHSIVFLKLIPVHPGNNGVNVKRLYLAGETLFACKKRNPISFMDQCESIHISCNRPFKAAMESWKSRNGSKVWFFTMERTEEVYR